MAIPRDEQVLLCAFVDWLGVHDIGLGRVLRHSNGRYITDGKGRPKLRPLTAQECADLADTFMSECNKLVPQDDPLVELNQGHAFAGLPTDVAQVAPVSALEAIQHRGSIHIDATDWLALGREIEKNADTFHEKENGPAMG